MEKRLMQMFDKETLLERLNRLLKIVCCNDIMTEFNLQEEMFVIFEIKEAIEEQIK
jgi:hypothetical protein